jgi:hypothetical protein
MTPVTTPLFASPQIMAEAAADGRVLARTLADHNDCAETCYGHLTYLPSGVEHSAICGTAGG